ncbi:hypothetical protein H8E88_07240 [candidate division KSB1 bacterium]|nr:hypothetical protein [candidate division KSB1 bacterium]MBL7093902.1 hypothetical protein [candidate division KSB1 bacterium]
MSAKKYIYGILALFLLILIAGCAGTKKININDAYLKVKPVAPLPQYVTNKQAPNLVIRINNVADLSSSYKNRIDLYINNFLIRPDEEITNVKSNYLYKVRLQPGIFEVRAKYFASTGWQEKTFKLAARDQVMIFPDKQALLKINLKKNNWGGLEDKISYFDLTYDTIDQGKK